LIDFIGCQSKDPPKPARKSKKEFDRRHATPAGARTKEAHIINQSLVNAKTVPVSTR
jgi:hypothetical protein